MTPWPGPGAKLALLLAMFLVRLVPGLWAAWPVAEAGLPSLHVLLEPGGLHLLEALRVGRHAWAETAPRLVLAAGFTAFFGLWPTAAWLYAHCLEAKPRFAEFLVTSLRYFGSLALLGVMMLVGYVLLGIAAAVVLIALATLLDASAALWAGVLVAGTALVAFVLLGIVHDLARAYLVRHDTRAWEAVRGGFRAFGARPLVAWGWRWMCGIAVVVAAAWVAGRVGAESAVGAAGVLGIEGVALFGLVALRASFLGVVVRGVR